MDASPGVGKHNGQSSPGAATAAPLRVLVAYATKYGSTAEMAGWIAEELREAGATVDVAPAAAASAPGDYGAVVLGGPMIFGWHKDCRRFLRRHAAKLADRPTALFITCINLTATGEDRIEGIPLTNYPWLVKEPHRPGRLSYRERHATPRHYLEGIRAAAPGVHPSSAAFFGGFLDLTKMSLLEKLFVMLVVRATPGDARSEGAVRTWARTLTDEPLV